MINLFVFKKKNYKTPCVCFGCLGLRGLSVPVYYLAFLSKLNTRPTILFRSSFCCFQTP